MALHFYQVNQENNLFSMIEGFQKDRKPDKELPDIKQDLQILHIADWCNACGNCTTFCPTSGSPFKDKPHLYIDRESFEKEKDGYYLEKATDKFILHHKLGDHYSILSRNDDELMFREKDHSIYINRLSDNESTKSLEGSNMKLNYNEVAEMNIIMDGAISFLC
jgi:putative selenate reductase